MTTKQEVDKMLMMMVALFADSVAQRVIERQSELRREEPVTPAKKDEKELMSMKDACTMLGICRVTLNNWRNDGLVKAHCKGRKVYFFKSELLASLENRNSRQGGRMRRSGGFNKGGKAEPGRPAC